MPKADISTLTITELTGLKRVVTLRGPSLPFQGASWGGSERVVTTWYPGNAMEATQHVLGPTEQQSSWEGMWRTTQLLRVPVLCSVDGSTPRQIVRAFDVWELVEDVFRLGQRLAVVWQNKIPGETVQRKVLREGRCVEWEFSPDRADDVAWSFTFDWSSRGVRQQKILNRRTENIQATIRGAHHAADEAAAMLKELHLVSSNKAIAGSANQFSLGDLENFLSMPTDLMSSFSRKATYLTSRFQQLGDLFTKMRSVPGQLANQALDVAQNTVDTANQFADEWSRRPPEANLADMKTAQLVKAMNAGSDLLASVGTMQSKALELQAQAENAAKDQGDILAVHIARASVTQLVDGEVKSGELLASISAVYYLTVDHAADIAKANNLPMNQQFVDRGTILIIPRLDNVKGANVGGA